MGEVETIKITRAELEKPGEEFLMRAMRIFALQQDWIRFCITAGFLPDYQREKVFSLALKGLFGQAELNSQAREGRGFFEKAGRPSEQEEEFRQMIEACISRGEQGDIVFALGHDRGRGLVVSEIEEVVLACLSPRRLDIAREAANNLPLTKRANIMGILS